MQEAGQTRRRHLSITLSLNGHQPRTTLSHWGLPILFQRAMMPIPGLSTFYSDMDAKRFGSLASVSEPAFHNLLVNEWELMRRDAEAKLHTVRLAYQTYGSSGRSETAQLHSSKAKSPLSSKEQPPSSYDYLIK